MKPLLRWVLSSFLLLAGVSLPAQKTGLLLIDIQQFYFPGGKVQLDQPERAGMNAGLLLEAFRSKRYPVYHVRHDFEPGGEIHEYVRPLGNEPVITKDRVNAFAETPLLEKLRADSVTTLVVCGMQTHMCVEAAVRAARDYGFHCILVEDACATRALQYHEHIVPARHVHYSTLSSLSGSYARITTTQEFLLESDW